MRLYYDLHIHSSLSPCGDNDMTPNNIVNMAKLNELDIIAITDHNSCKNCSAAIKVGNEVGVTVVPGMELTTSEDIHVVCLFPDLESAEAFDGYVYERLMKVPNEADIFGHQYVMDENDEITGEEENLLICACCLSIYEVFDVVKKCGGVAVPAHIDKNSYSVLSNLGFLPEDLDVPTLEITPKNRYIKENEYKNHNIISNSDAHYLEDISEPEFFMELEERSIEGVLKFLGK